MCPFTYNKEKNIIDDIFGNFIGELSENDGINNYKKNAKSIKSLGGMNSLLPIIELMTNNTELLTKENFTLYLTLISNYVFSPLYQHAIMKENDSNFFMSLSYFLEKIPDSFFNTEFYKLCNLYVRMKKILKNQLKLG